MVAILTLFATLVVGGLAVLAQWARKSRGAEISLIVTLLALSLLVAGLGALTGIGLLVAASEGRGAVSGSDQLAFVGAGVAAILAGLIGAGLCVPPLLKVTGRPPKRAFWADPPMFLALWLLVVVLTNNAVSFLIFTQESDVSTLFPGGRLSLGEIVSSQLPFVIVAVLGVGIGVRRTFRETLRRLGYTRISPSQAGIAVLFIILATLLSVGADAAFQTLQPGLYKTVGDVTGSLFDTGGLSPASAILFSLLIGVGAALGEETLFRGAVQPRLGIPLTSVLFASMHIQYGPSVLLVFVFVLSVGLGLLRRRVNTTASFIAHAGYNATGVLLSYFLGF
ncbi:MAG TPA: CPBP family intramembrane glutamic endopeptidase [Rubrobacteraceae bacterium]|nr:CPBP family intramembrane glutamic endopeptidase [Rubrobacteraceae bacterium]